MDAVQIIIVFSGVVAAVVLSIGAYYLYLIGDEERSFKKPKNCIGKYIKKQRLIVKFTPDKQKQLYLLQMMKNDKNFIKFFIHQIHCELRLLDRIKKL